MFSPKSWSMSLLRRLLVGGGGLTTAAATASVFKKARMVTGSSHALLRRIVAPLIPAEALHALDGDPHDGV
jgi:hypothetical protein